MPWWATFLNSALFGIIVPFVVGFVVHVSRVKAQRLPEHRIPDTERLASQAARSIMLRSPAAESRMELADIAFIALLEEYDVRIPSKKAREHALSAAFFDVKSDG